MFNPHFKRALLIAVTLFSFFAATLCSNQIISAQQPQQQQSQTASTATTANDERTRGFALYKQGQFEAAIRELREWTKKNKPDAEAWYVLGVAYLKTNDLKAARKNFEQALKANSNYADARAALAYVLLLQGKDKDAAREAQRAISADAKNAFAYYIVGYAQLYRQQPTAALAAIDRALQLDPKFAAAWLLRSQALLDSPSAPPLPGANDADALDNLSLEEKEASFNRQAARFKEAAEALEKYLALSPASAADRAEITEQLATLRFYATGGGRNPQSAASPDAAYRALDVDKRAAILSKPQPGYTDKARAAQASGVVRLRAVLAWDGKVKYIVPIKRLGYGLTEAAIAAARGIKFQPAIKNGARVSQFVVLEYSFTLF